MLLGYIWLLGIFVSRSCDIKINTKKSKLLNKVSGERVKYRQDCKGGQQNKVDYLGERSEPPHWAVQSRFRVIYIMCDPF